MAVHVGLDAIPIYSIADEKPPGMNESDTFDIADDHEEDSIQSNLSDSGTEDDDSVYRFDKKSSSYGSARRFFNKSSSKTWKGNKKLLPEDISKEFLTLQFQDDDDDKGMTDIEKVAVKKGKSLKESIEGLLHERGIDFTTHSVFLESSKTPLPLAFDTFPLGGNVLHVKENISMQVDERIITLMKSAEDDKRMQNQRPKKNLMSSIFNDDVEASPVSNKSQSMTRKSGVASGYKDEGNRTLSGLLSEYTFNAENEVDGFESDLEELEESWTDVITEYEGMSNRDKIQQETIWELLITERNYLRKIRVIIVVFKNCLINLQKDNYLEDVDIDRLFANIKEVYDTNFTFWEDYLKHVTEEARQTKLPIKPSQLHDSFACFEELFQPYIRYCLEEGSCMKYLKKLKRENEMFQEYLAWCENHQQCMRLKLADLFVKPMQRVTKYALLLKAVLGKTSDEDEKISLENMICHVDRFVTKINTTLRLRNEQQKLDAVLDRIEMYIPIEAANEEMEKILESQLCKFDLHGNIPGLPEEEQRCILLEGPMKMIEKQGRVDVYAFLFTDLMVLAKAKKGTDKYRIIRQPFRLNKISLHRSKDPGAFIFIYLNEYAVLVTAFTLQVSANEQTKWMTAIEKAKKRYENARAAKGSTLAFFDDDLTISTSALVTSISSTVSPIADRRSVISTDDNRLDPASVNKDDLRSRSTEAVTRSYHKPEDVISDSHVKRSFSDPKAGISYSVRERSSSKQKGRQRPKSLVNISDHDIATWVLTNENRNQSGSITSDISDDSQRSSGIGDSFRSINSEGGLIMTFSNMPEMSKVAQLKARFENQGSDSPVGTEGSDSSVSTPSVLGFVETSPALASTRRISPPDYMDEHLTIKEEEEQSTHNNIDRTTSMLSSIADSENTENDSSESLRTLNDGESTLRLSNHSFENRKLVKVPLTTKSFTSAGVQTDFPVRFAHTDVKECAIQCNIQPESIDDITNKIDTIVNGLLDEHNDDLLEDLVSSPEKELVYDSSDEIAMDEFNGHVDFEITTSADNSVSEDLSTLVDDDSASLSDENTTIIDVEITECIVDSCENSGTTCSLLDTDKPMQFDAGTQYEELKTGQVDENTENNDKSKVFSDTFTQYEALCSRDTSTQCGDFIQLAGSSDAEDGGSSSAVEKPRSPVKNKNNENLKFNVDYNCTAKPLFRSSFSDEGPKGRSVSPFMDMLTQTSRPRSAQTQRKQQTLKHSYSEANIHVALSLSHCRSRSDELQPQRSSLPNSPEHKHRNSAPTTEFPGMRALQTLSESLESRLEAPPCNSKPIIKHYDDMNDGLSADTNNRTMNKNVSQPVLVRHNSSSSTSLRKLALMNNSPLIGKKELDDNISDNTSNTDAETLEVDSFNEDGLMFSALNQSSPKLRNRVTSSGSGAETKNTAAEPNSKRFTWHDFDSLTALRRIEQTKYGPSGRASTLPLAKNLSKSTEIISSNKKSSLKRSIIKRFTDVLNRSDDSRSSLDHSSLQVNVTDEDKSLKKKQKKEMKKLKKERKQREKDDRKSSTKLRSSSVSSSNSRNSIPLSSTNSYGGSFVSHASSGGGNSR